MSALTARRFLVAAVLGCCLALFTAAPAFAQKGYVQARHPTYKYGCSAYIEVNNAPTYYIQKVNSIWTYRTDESAYCEMGVTWDVDRYRPYAFWTYGQNGVPGATHPIQEVAEGSYPRFHTGYGVEEGYHYFWFNNEIVTMAYIPSMTSCWPGTNSEGEDPGRGDYSAHFKSLKYKTSAWGVWQPFTNVEQYYDNVPYYYFKKWSTTEHYVLHV